MKKDIHPKYYPNSKIHCACGNSFEVGSTKESIETEVCFKCHPFYTGKDKVIDIAGRVEKFKKRLAKKSEFKEVKPKKQKVKPTAKKVSSIKIPAKESRSEVSKDQSEETNKK